MDEILKWFQHTWKMKSVRQAVISILIVLVVIIVWWLISRMLRKHREKKALADSGSLTTASSGAIVVRDVIKISFIVLLILVVLQINGVNVTSLLAGLGVASAVVGLALQDFLKDIIMGLHVLSDDFFKIGDMIQYGKDEGTVISFTLRTTKIKSLADGDIISICNRNIDEIAKSSNEVYVHAPLPYELTVSKSIRVMDKVCKRAKKIDDHIKKCQYLGTTDFCASYVDHLFKVIIDQPINKLSTRRSVLYAIRSIYEEEEIPFPYDQLDVHMVPGDTPTIPN